MSILRLAARNTRRQMRRSILTAFGIAIAVMTVTFMDAYLIGIMDAFLTSFIRIEAGFIKVLPVEGKDRVRPLPLDEGINNVSHLVEEIGQVEGVTTVAPRIRFGVLLEKEGGAVPAMGVAVIPSHEKGLLELDEWVIEGHAPGDFAAETLIGKELAEELGLKVGDELFIVASTSYGGLGPGLYQVSGIFRSGISMIDRKTFYIPLSQAQYQLAMDDSALEITLGISGGVDGTEEVADRVKAKMDELGRNDLIVLPWQEQGGMVEIIAPMDTYIIYFFLLMGIIATTTVVNTVLMSVMERIREIGALRAMGFERKTIIRMILMESLIVGSIGTLLGLILGMGLSLWLGHIGINLSGALEAADMPIIPIIHPDPSWMTAIKAGIMGLIVSLLAAWYPARVAVRLEPATALRTHQ